MLDKNFIKKYFLGITVFVYIFSYFINSFLFSVKAEDSVQHTDIVAIFVEEDLYSSIQGDLDWYATTYLQEYALTNTKAVVLPVNIDDFQAKDLVKILENIYFDGIEGESSSLIGAIFFGDIPLPVINDNGFIYPSIYPYVDFENQKFIWSPNDNFFVPNNIANGQAEIWHSIINFDTSADYSAFFEKLENYKKDPSSFAEKKIWYEDFVANKKYFNLETLPYYINNFLFAEDIAYHRYTDLMMQIFQGAQVENLSELLSEYSDDPYIDGATTATSPTYTLQKTIFEGFIKSYSSLFSEKYLNDIQTNLEVSNRWVDSFTGLDNKRRESASVDTHFLMTDQSDESLLRSNMPLNGILLDLNGSMETALNEKVEAEKYYMSLPLPLTYLNYEGNYKRVSLLKKACIWDKYEAYENYYFGKKASTISTLEDTNIYRGTYRNLDSLEDITIGDIQSSNNPAIDIDNLDLNKKSIGASYDIFSTQVSSNRAYNMFNVKEEVDIYTENKIADQSKWKMGCTKYLFGREWLGICVGDTIFTPKSKECNLDDEDEQEGCEDTTEFAMRNWGGASPLNITGESFDQRNEPFEYTGAVRSVFDVGGSQSTQEDISAALTQDSLSQYTNLVQVRFGGGISSNISNLAPDLPGIGYRSDVASALLFPNQLPLVTKRIFKDDINWIDTKPKVFSTVDYFKVFNITSEKNNEGSIIKLANRQNAECYGDGEVYTYKTLDSRIYHNNIRPNWIGGSVYSIFEDDQSLSKVFADGINNSLDLLSDKIGVVESILTSLDTEGPAYYMDELEINVTDINTIIASVTNFDINTLTNYSGAQISSLATNWTTAITEASFFDIEVLVEDTIQSLAEIQGFFEMFSFKPLLAYIEDELYASEINRYDILVLSQWVLTWFNQLDGFISKIQSIPSLLDGLKSKYSEIGTIYTSTDVFTQKKSSINALQMCGDPAVTACGCSQDYSELCSALDTLRHNVSAYGSIANDNIDKISSYEETILDEDGDSLGTVDQYPIQDTLDVAEDLESILSGQKGDINNILSTLEQSSDIALTGTSEGINLVTQNRPIDSPRYLTFEGVGGDNVKLIYPDLYKVEVFNEVDEGLQLKTPEEIEVSLVSYLQNIVKKYNEYLLSQNDKKDLFYDANSSAFDLLGQLDELANPNSSRSLNLLDEDFFIDYLEEQILTSDFLSKEIGDYTPLQFIAQAIYKHNIGWKDKTEQNTIKESLQSVYDDFDINQKIQNTLETYLTQDNEQGEILSPQYNQTGYEVGYFNSDGMDYIVTDELDTSIIETLNSSSKSYSDDSTENTPEDNESSSFVDEIGEKCGINMDEPVLLFDISDMTSPWRKAFMCWRDQIKETPLELKFSRDSSMGQVLDAGYESGSQNIKSDEMNLGDVLSQVYDDAGDNLDQTIEAYQDSLGKYGDQWKALAIEDDNEEALASLEGADQQRLSDFVSYVQFKLEDATLSPEDNSTLLSISSAKNFGDLSLKLSTVGDNCILFNSKKVCDDSISFIYDPYAEDSSLSIKLDTADVVAGYNVLTLEYCIGAMCAKKVQRLNVVPGFLDNTDIVVAKDSIYAGASVPFQIIGNDVYGNNVAQQINRKFVVKTEQGSLNKGYNYNKEEIVFDDFSKNVFIYNAPKDFDGKVQIFLYERLLDEDVLLSQKDLTVVNVIPYLTYSQDGWNAGSQDGEFIIDLPEEITEYKYLDTNNISQINKDNLPYITLKLKKTDGSILDTLFSANLKSKKGLLNFGEVRVRNIEDSINQNYFDQQSIFSAEQYVDIYFYPTFKAGEDTLILQVQGLDTIEIPVQINTSSPKIVSLSLEQDSLSLGSSVKGYAQIFDRWNNRLFQDVGINLGVMGDIELSQTPVFDGMQYNFEITSKDTGGKGYIISTIKGLAADQQESDTKEIIVQDTLLPQEGLNVMYLNLFGSDWGNQWGYFSDNNGFVENLFVNSDKLLSATTQLISPEKLKKFVVLLNNDGSISSLLDETVSLDITEDSFVYSTSLVGSVYQKYNGLSFTQIEDVINIEEGGNILYYLPEQLDSVITGNTVVGNTLVVNGAVLFDLDGGYKNTNLKISAWKGSDEVSSWLLTYNGKKLGKFYLSLDDFQWTTLDLKSGLYSSSVWSQGSTNSESSLGIFQSDSEYQVSNMGYDSIQDSLDTTAGIGFRGDFKNITHFAGGLSVGEATKDFSSEFLINIGDPLLRRVTENESLKIYDEEGIETVDTYFDSGIGAKIYADSSFAIQKPYVVDFNNDGLDDVLLSLSNSQLKILKNNGGGKPFSDLGRLIFVADGIKEVYFGDVDGDDYQDILVLSKDDKLRVYKNERGVIQVDGNPVCINTNVVDGNISSNPEDISQVNQIFFEDMDNDGKTDIISNDALGYVKIFFGGDDSYVSQLTTTCDDAWYTRQSGKEKILERFAIDINESDKVLDSSMIRWIGLGLEDDANYDDTTAEDLGLEGIDGLEGNDDVGAVLDIVSQYSQTKSLDTFMQKYPNLVSDPVGVVPRYETDDTEAGSISYMPISYLTSEMPIDAYKKYDDINGGVLENGDEVEISVYLTATESFVGTFIDQIQGPWKIITRDDGSIKTFWFEENTVSLNTIEDELGLYWNIPNGYYMMDNIQLAAGKQLIFHYLVEYMGAGVSPITISIDDVDGELYDLSYSQDDKLDIKVKPSDACTRIMNVFFNQGGRSFSREYIDLQEMMDDYLAEQKEEQETNTADLNEDIESSLSAMDISSLMGDDTMELWKNVGSLTSNEELQSILDINFEGTALATLDTLGRLFGKDILESATQACQGFSLPDGGGNCKGLPVPFNQAFLAPGTYHLFGCFELKFLDNIIGGGVPMLFFPSTLTTPVGTIPSIGPWLGPQKMSPTDGFDIWPAGGVYPSMFRMYLAPTLTAQLGVGICFGPYGVGAAIPSPISDVVGNCLVFAIQPQCGSTEVNKNDISSGAPEETATTDGPFADLGACNMSNIPPKAQQEGYTPSFATLVQGTSSSKSPFVLPSSNAFDFVVLDVQPVYEGYSSVEDTTTFAGVKIEGGASSQNKILGSNAKGIIATLMRGWLDKQVKYILNNVTNMSLNIYLPEIEDLFQGFDKISESNSDYKQDKCDKLEGTWNFDLGVCEDKKVEDSSAFDLLKNNLQDILVSGNLDVLSDAVNYTNPFDKWAAMFEEVPLIRMRTENINVQIPLLTAREIDSYEQYLQEWIERNKEIMGEWDALFSKLFNACSDTTVDSYSDMASAYSNIVAKLQEETLADPINLVSEGKLSIAKSQVLSSMVSQEGAKDFGDIDVYQGCEDNIMYVKSYDTSSYETILAQGSFQQYNMVDGSLTSLPSIPSCLGTKVYSSLSEACVDTFMSQGFANALSSYLNINSNVEKTISAIKENIEILEMYKKFPIELYEWVRVQDRYIQELTSLVQNFLGTISLWMEVNSSRLSQYVDAVILIISTIKTYQLIIDFSTEWSESCGSCTQDNYDSYTCKLSFLCQGLELPVLPIPPFKLPNINIDLSHISLGLDIKLPKFNFQPLSIDLPVLPDIPTPPMFDFNINIDDLNIPDVPVLPKPPVLQPLPSFLPEIKMQLPVLPPAPKIPTIPNEITEIITVAKNISKILCIVKKGIGFVGEKSLKARIEQMTQRTYEVPFWDTQDLTPKWLQNTMDVAGDLSSSQFAETPQYGFDYQIDSYVNLQYNFAGVYSLFDELAHGLNSFSNDLSTSVNLASSAVSSFSSDLSVGLQECINNPSKEACAENSLLASSFKDLATSLSTIDQQSEDLESLFVQTKKVVTQKSTLQDNLDTLELERQDIVDAITLAQQNLTSDRAVNNKAYVEQQNYIIETNQNLLVDIDLEISDTIQQISQLNTIYAQQQTLYQEKVSEFDKESENYSLLKRGILDKSMEPVNQSQEILNQLQTEYDQTQKTVESIQEEMNFTKDQKMMEIQENATQEEISFVEYDSVVAENSKANLLALLANIDDDALSAELKNKTKDLVAYIDYSPEASVINVGEELGKSAETVFEDYKATNDQLAYVINDDYDNFIQKVSNSDIQLVAGEDIDMTISLPLLSVDQRSKDLLSSNPLQEYLDYQEGEVDSYLNSLENSIPIDLNMTENTYQKTKNLLSDVKNKIDTLQYTYVDKVTTNPNIKSVQLAQATSTSSTDGSELDFDNIDLGSYVNGVFVKVKDDQVVSVVKSSEYAEKLEDNHYFVDLNQDGDEDLLLWDSNNVYVKYYDQNSTYKAEKHFSKSYVYRLTSLEDLISDQSNGYVSIRDIDLKLYDENREVKNFAVKGQSFDSLTLSWMNSKILGDVPDAYLLKLSHRVDYFPDKESTDVSSSWANKKYVLALPKGYDTGSTIQLEEIKDSVEDLLDDYIYEVALYDSVQDKISVQMTKAPRNWQYAKVMTLKLVGDTYYINSPDSNQIVAGMQIIADDQGPLADVSLYRPSVGKTIAEGSNLIGYVGTDYILKTKWEDNVELFFVQIQDEEGNVLVEKQGIQQANQDLNIEGLFFDYPQTLKYILYGEDIEGNSYDDTITFTIKNPDIDVVEINRLFPDSKVSPISLVAELSNDIDKGYVSFNKYNEGKLENLSASKDGNTQTYFPVTAGESLVVGEYFDMGNMVGFYDQQGHVVVTLDSTNGQVSLSAGYEDDYSIVISFDQKVPTINIIEKATGEIRFTLALPTDSLVDIQPGIWVKNTLAGEEWGAFDKGYVLTKNGVAMIYVATDGTIYTEQTIYGDYEYDAVNGTIKYYFRDTLIGANVGYIEVKATSFLEE